MDVRELLRAGIDVYATLAMQQVESLNNTGTEMPRFPKGAIVPDSLINRADEIEVVDVALGTFWKTCAEASCRAGSPHPEDFCIRRASAYLKCPSS